MQAGMSCHALLIGLVAALIAGTASAGDPPTLLTITPDGLMDDWATVLTNPLNVTLDGDVSVLAGNVGGTSLGRPYGGGSFSVASNGRFAFTETRPEYPADVAVGQGGETRVRHVTRLNQDLFGYRDLGKVEEIWYESSYDKRRIQGWILTPPGLSVASDRP